MSAAKKVPVRRIPSPGLPPPLAPASLYTACPVADLAFATTAELADLGEEFIHVRAVEALRYPRNPLDVLAQQMVATVAAVGAAASTAASEAEPAADGGDEE